MVDASKGRILTLADELVEDLAVPWLEGGPEFMESVSTSRQGEVMPSNERTYLEAQR
jgi:hypothetical protein